MNRILLLMLLVVGLGAACAPPPVRFPGAYHRLNRLYVNDTVGFRLELPRYWSVADRPRGFTVPLDLRPDQEQVLEAYDLTSKLGLVIVIQEGPLLDIVDLVQRMQAVPEAQVRDQLRSPRATGGQQTALREIVISGMPAAEWIYTVTDTTGGRPVDMTVSTYILKMGQRYVYLTFSVPSDQDTMSRAVIQSILDSFQRHALKTALQAT